MSFTVEVYKFAASLPVDERYNLSQQLRRAATSVPLNIAEGCGCATDAEFVRFLGYAYRSLKEVITCLELCERLYPPSSIDAIGALIDEADQISRMTRTLMQRLGGAFENWQDA